MKEVAKAFWSVPSSELLQQLDTTPKGLTEEVAKERLKEFSATRLKPQERSKGFLLCLSQFKGPIIIILLLAAGLSFFLRDPTDALIILAIVLVSGLLGFWQEKGAANAIEKLLSIVQTKATVLRDGNPVEVSLEDVVPGDVVILSAGGSIPGDCMILESKDLFLNEAALTGETYPVGKRVGNLEPETPLARRTNTLFMGTHVVSGTAKAVVVRVGADTEFGKVSERLKLRPPETEFTRGVRRFGYYLMEVTLIMVIAIFAVNVLLIKTGPRFVPFFIGPRGRADSSTAAGNYHH